MGLFGRRRRAPKTLAIDPSWPWWDQVIEISSILSARAHGDVERFDGVHAHAPKRHEAQHAGLDGQHREPDGQRAPHVGEEDQDHQHERQSGQADALQRRRQDQQKLQGKKKANSNKFEWVTFYVCLQIRHFLLKEANVFIAVQERQRLLPVVALDCVVRYGRSILH